MTAAVLQCRCGILQGFVRLSARATRALCYCADCQAYARFLGVPVVDEAGGTEVIATQPRHVQFISGLESLACLSLKPRGLLRWYARCCRTPIGNTPRNPRVAYVGLVHTCLGDTAARRASFGPVRIAVNMASAHGPVPALRLGTRAVALFNLGSSLLDARLSGGYRQTPFFDPDVRPGSAAPGPWPYAQPTWVFSSRQLPAVPGADIRFANGDVHLVHDRMRAAADGKNLWLVGGGELLGQFHDAGLLDELIIQVGSVRLGAGKPLLPRRITSPSLKLMSVRRFGDGFAELRYEVPGPDPSDHAPA